MRVRFRSWWQLIRNHWLVAIIIVFVVLMALIFVGYWFDWTGFNGYNKVTITHTISGINVGTVTRTEEYQPGKALWDWLGLLAALAIPIVVGFGAAWFTTKQTQASEAANQRQHDTELEISTDNQREAALQAYIDKISELLLKEHLGERTEDGQLKPEYEQVRNIARVRTITVLFQLDARRIGYVFAFLREAGLIPAKISAKPTDSIVSLKEVDFSGKIDFRQVDLRNVDLSRANLEHTDFFRANLALANLKNAILFKANFSEANLWRADLQIGMLLAARLDRAKLREADLSNANLGSAIFTEADLSNANLSNSILNGADFTRANLSEADLTGADLSRADLTGAKGMTIEELEKQAKSLKGAIMPNGKMYRNSSRAVLREANLSGVDLSGIDLSEAYLNGANLSRANLNEANLWSADLSGANLKGVTGITSEELEKQAKSLAGATMPDGSKHP